MIAFTVPRRAWVTEWHRLPCSVCGAVEWCLAVFVGKRWQSGADPEGPPLLALCKPCLESSDVGPYVGPEVP